MRFHLARFGGSALAAGGAITFALAVTNVLAQARDDGQDAWQPTRPALSNRSADDSRDGDDDRDAIGPPTDRESRQSGSRPSARRGQDQSAGGADDNASYSRPQQGSTNSNAYPARTQSDSRYRQANGSDRNAAYVDSQGRPIRYTRRATYSSQSGGSNDGPYYGYPPARVRTVAYDRQDVVYLDDPGAPAVRGPMPGPVVYGEAPPQIYEPPMVSPGVCGPPVDGAVGGEYAAPENYNRYRSPQLWYAGVEGTFLTVTRHGPPAVDIETHASPPIDDPSTNELNTEYGVGPRVWVGIELGDCWGLRGRFWSFRDNANGEFGSPGVLNGVGTGNFAVGSYDLSAYTIDVEATKSWDCGPWYFEASLGARYAQMRQDGLLAFFEPVDDTTAFGSASRRINGTGVTGSLEAHRCLGESGWNLFANGRGSVLWGSTDGLATMAADAYFGGDSFASDSDSIRKSATMYIVEAQAGIEWTHPVKCICGTVFVRGACEYQRWTARNPGSAVATGETVGDTVTTVVTSTVPSTTIGLLGLNIAAGFRF